MDHIPKLGFGTYKLRGDVAFKSTLCALRHDYTHIDTANLYRNEEEIGKAIKESRIERCKLWITTKIQVKDIRKGKDAMLESINNSLSQLGVEYLDLVLLHGPADEMIESTWKFLEEIVLNDLKGKIRFIGVSNYGIKHLEIVLKDCKIKPYTNQIEVNPYYQRNKLRSYCQENGIIVTAYSSLIKGEKFSDTKLEELSQNTKISKPLLLLVWAVDKDMIVLPRSSKEEHIIENMKCLDITLDKKVIQELDGFQNGDSAGYCTHPQYREIDN